MTSSVIEIGLMVVILRLVAAVVIASWSDKASQIVSAAAVWIASSLRSPH